MKQDAIDSYDDSINQDKYDDAGYSGSNIHGETIPDKPTIDKFYDTEAILYAMEKTFRGYQKEQNRWVYKSRPIARDEFINQIINSLRSVVNPENILSKKTDEEIEVILLEKNNEIIDMCEDEITLGDEHIESVINICDHTMELFLGLVANGHGAQTLKEIYAGVSHSLNPNDNKEDSVFRLAVGDKDIINVGRNR